MRVSVEPATATNIEKQLGRSSAYVLTRKQGEAIGPKLGLHVDVQAYGEAIGPKPTTTII